MTLRCPDTVKIFQDLYREITPNAAGAVEIGRRKGAVCIFRGDMFRDPFQFTERCRQEIAVLCHTMDPAQLLGAGEKRFEPVEGYANQVD
jgi:hypothetical protein